MSAEKHFQTLIESLQKLADGDAVSAMSLVEDWDVKLETKPGVDPSHKEIEDAILSAFHTKINALIRIGVGGKHLFVFWEGLELKVLGNAKVSDAAVEFFKVYGTVHLGAVQQANLAIVEAFTLLSSIAGKKTLSKTDLENINGFIEKYDRKQTDRAQSKS